MKTYAILLCGGKSERFGKDKLLMPFLGKPIFLYALEMLNANKLIDKIFIIASKKNHDVIARDPALPARHGGTGNRSNLKNKLEKIILGGKTRQDSVKKAVFYIEKNYKKPDFLVIHNGANPFVTDMEITKCVNFLKKNKKITGVGVARKISKTIKKINRHGQIIQTLNRANLFEMETPQAVRFKEFLMSLRGLAAQSQFTDDLSILEAAGFKTYVLPASEKNRKITFVSDFPFTPHIPKNPLEGSFLTKLGREGYAGVNFRMGIGEDSHNFSRKHRGLHLGGVLFKKFPKLEADSDGDVMLHAIATAISQAIGKGSLGTFATPLFKKGIRDSAVYLKKILEQLKSQNFKIQNIGINIEAAKPKIDPLAPQIKKTLSKLIGILQSQIGITAHSGEKLTQFGKGRGIRCTAIVTLT